MTSSISAAEQRVLDHIDPGEIITTARALIAAPGENPPGGEGPTARALALETARMGLDRAVTEVAPGRPNVSVTYGDGAEPGLLLLGHTDVVPVGDGWTVSPTGGEVRDGRLYGRGSTDMKGGLAACLAAMAALRRAGARLRGPIELAAVIDEEDSGLGVRRFLADRAALRTHVAGRADMADGAGARPYRACVVAEPTDLQTIIAARGAAYLRVHVTGKAAHAGNPADGINAIYGAARIATELERWHHELAAAAHPLIGPATWNVGMIQGGTGGSIVPAECALVLDRRLLPGDDPAQVLADTRARIDALGLAEAGMRVDIEMPMDMPGFETPPDHELVTVTQRAVGQAGGPVLPLGGWTAACDGGYVNRDEGVPVVVLGPGSVQTQAHRADESVGLDELLAAARAYALIALRLLG
jgi:acetylornithine deacetylase